MAVTPPGRMAFVQQEVADTLQAMQRQLDTQGEFAQDCMRQIVIQDAQIGHLHMTVQILQQNAQVCLFVCLFVNCRLL